jgi:hypothetical protein
MKPEASPVITSSEPHMLKPLVIDPLATGVVA